MFGAIVFNLSRCLQMDFDSYYTLLHAFDLTGRSMFGKSWEGGEVGAILVEAPDAILERKTSIESRLLRLREEDHRLQLQAEEDVSDVERNAITQDSNRVWDERDTLRKELNSLPVVSDSWIDDVDFFKRRQAVEAELRNAFRTSELTIVLYSGRHVAFENWETEPHFVVSFALSIVVLPPRARGGRGPRRSAGFVRKVELHSWLKRFSENEAMAGELSAEAQCRAWLRELAKKKKEKGKADYRDQALQLFSGLSGRKFDSLWAEDSIIPISWKKPGPVTK